MSDFWRILAISAYGSALAWRSRAVAQGHLIDELLPLENYSNLQKATADYRTIEAAALSVLTDSGGGGPVNWETLEGVPDEFNPTEHAFTHALDGSDPIYPLTIGARPVGVNIPWNELDTPLEFNPSSHASSHGVGQSDEITPQSIGACELTGGLVPINRLPPLAITDRFSAASNAEMIALNAQMGDICFRSDQGRYYQKVNTEGSLTDWIAWLEPPVLSVNGLNGDVVLPPLTPALHAATHHLGGTDALSAEAIGAEAAGVAQSLLITHINEPNPHPQYRRQGIGIPLDHIVGVGMGNIPILNFTPFTDGAWTLINGVLPTLKTINDPPAGNEGLPCWEAPVISAARLSYWIVPASTTAYRITAFARSLSSPKPNLVVSLRRVQAGTGAILRSPALSLTLTSNWQQYDLNQSFSASNSIYVAFDYDASGGSGAIAQIYAPQLSVAS